MIYFSLSSSLGISTILWGTRSLAGDRTEPRMVLCMWLQVRLFKARAPALFVPGHLSLISQRRPTAHTLLPLLFPWLLIWLWWAPLNFLVFMASTQRTFLPSQRQNPSTRRDGRHAELFTSRGLHVFGEMVWFGSSFFYVRSVLVNILWKASLCLLCRGSELAPFRGSPGYVACVVTWPSIHIGLRECNC